MPTRKAKPERDVTKAYPLSQFADKLRRLADAVEGGERFRIQVAGERVSIPPDAMISVEHERGEDGEEVEFQITWKSPGAGVRREGRSQGEGQGRRRGETPVEGGLTRLDRWMLRRQVAEVIQVNPRNRPVPVMRERPSIAGRRGDEACAGSGI